MIGRNLLKVIISLVGQSHLAALSTVSRISPDALLPRLLSHALCVFADPALTAVTRAEHALLHWPEGELYDKSVVEA